MPYSITGRGAGELTLGGGEWRGTADAGVDDGERVITAGWDGGPTASQTFRVIATPPSVTLHPKETPSRSPEDTDVDMTARWKKYEVVPVQVESNRQLQTINPSSFTNPGVTTSTACTRSCPVNKYCTCFAVDLAQQTLSAAHGDVAIALSGAEDVYGNATTAIAPVNVPVTRFGWRRVVATGAASPTAVAIKTDGTVIAGSRTGLNGSALVSVTPAGVVTPLYSSATVAVTAGPMVGAQGDIYAAMFDSNIPVRAWLSINPGPSAIERCSSSPAAKYDGDMALFQPGTGELPVAIRDNKLVLGSDSCAITDITAFAGTPRIVVSGASAFVASMTRSPVWKLNPLNAAPAVTSTSTGGLNPKNLFLVGTALVGGGPSIGGIFAFADGATLPANTTNITFGSNPGGPAVVGGTNTSPVVFYGDDDKVVRRISMTLTPSFGSDVASPVLGGAIGGYASYAPLLGQGGKLYIAGTDGVLRALNSTTMQEEWSWGQGVLPTAPDSIAQLNLDKNRTAAMPCALGQPGVLYVAATLANTTTLYSLLVDSAGLDGNAPWPRYQHDPANTGNNATSLESWTCP